MPLASLVPFVQTLCSLSIYAKVAFGYLALVWILYAFQRRLLYQPTRLTLEQFLSKLPVARYQLCRHIPEFNALVLEPPTVPISHTAIFFHGSKGLGLDRMALGVEFLARGYRLVLAEYPGYGARPGLITEKSLVSDGCALYRHVCASYPGQSVTVIGESLGAAIAVQVAAEAPQPPACLVLITPFFSQAQALQQSFPFLPAKLLVKDKFKSFEHLRRYLGPVTVVVGDQDTRVRPSASVALFDVARSRGPATLLRLPRAGHSTWRQHLTSRDWDRLLPRLGA